MKSPKLIIVEAGHGLSPDGKVNDDGAAGNGTTERAEVVQIAQELLGRFRADPDFSGVTLQGLGIAERLSLPEKIKRVNKMAEPYERDDVLLLSIHLNNAGPDAEGVEAWIPTKGGSVELGNELVAAVTTATGLPKRGTFRSEKNRHKRLGILDDTKANGVLIECCFLSNAQEAGIVKDPALDDAFALGIHQGVRSFLGIKEKKSMPTFYADVPKGEWYHDAVKACLDRGILVMNENGLFHPEKPMTRAEFAMVQARLLELIDKKKK